MKRVYAIETITVNIVQIMNEKRRQIIYITDTDKFLNIAVLRDIF